MKKCSKFSILCVLLLAVREPFCKDKAVHAFTPSGPDAEVSEGDLFRGIWQKAKERRSVNGDGLDPDQTKKTRPQFECGHRNLTLFLQQTDLTNIRIYGALGGQHQLSQLAAFCGVSVKTTHSGVRLIFSYDGCYIKKKTEYVLSVSWYGTDMTMSCPVSVASPSVICKKNAMELTVVEGTVDDMFVALNGEWAPLRSVANDCWNRVPSNQGALTFEVPHKSCGVNFRGGRYTLNVKSKDKMMPFFCSHERLPVFPNSDLRFPVNVQPQNKPGVYHKPPAFPSTASEIKLGQRFGELERSAGKPHNTPLLQPRSSWLPKMPSLPKIPSLLPGSFNLAVNFPFSVPIPTRPPPGHTRDHFTSEPLYFTTSAPTPDAAATPDPIPDPTTPRSQQHRDLVPGFQNWHKHSSPNEQLQRNLTDSPKLTQLYSYSQLQKPASSLSHAEPSVQDYQHMRPLVPGTAQYQTFEPSHNVNFPRPHQHHLSDTLSNLAQHLPPGYFICSYNGQPQVLPQKFPVLQPAQPSQYQPYYYQNGYGHQGSSTTPPYPSQFIPVNLQSQAKPYPSFPAYQPARPLHPQHYQKPHMQIQQSGSPTPPMKESRPLVPVSSQTPQYVHYRPGGEQYFNPSRGVGRHTTETHTSSHPLYQQTHQSQFPYLSIRPQVPTDGVSQGYTGYTPPKSFFRPRSLPSASLHGSGDVLLESASLTQKSPSPFFPVQGHAELPYSQGPSFRYAKNPWDPFQNPSEPDSQKPQNDTMPPSYRQASVVNGVSPHLRSASTEVQPPRKASLKGSYFYRPPDADARK